jgi:hypothetical protein
MDKTRFKAYLCLLQLPYKPINFQAKIVNSLFLALFPKKDRADALAVLYYLVSR